MQEDKAVHFQELDQVLYNARLRRSADLGRWLKQNFEDRRQARLQERKGGPFECGPNIPSTRRLASREARFRTGFKSRTGYEDFTLARDAVLVLGDNECLGSR